MPPLSAVFALEEVGEAAYEVHQNRDEGKIGVLCVAPARASASTTPSARERQDRLTIFRRHDREAMLLTEIDHVAIAVNDLDAAIAWYAEVFGATVEHRERVESDGVDEALLRVADSYVQLLTPTREDSPVANFLARRGEGLHHVGYRVDGLRRGARGGARQRGPGDRRGAASGLARHDGRLRAPLGGLRHPGRAGRGPRAGVNAATASTSR